MPLERVEAAEETAAALRIEVDELSLRGERLFARAAASEREAVLLSEHLTTKSSLAGELRSEASVLRGEMEAARMERALLSDQLASVRAQLDGRIAELERARAELGDVRGELEGARAELSSVSTELGTTRNETDVMRRRIGEFSAEADDMRERLAAAERELELVNGQLDTAQASVLAFTAEVAASRASSAEITEELGRARHEADQLRVQLEQAAATATRAVSTEAALASATSELEAARQQGDERLRQLEQGTAEWQQTRELLEATERTRDAYAGHLKATSTTALGGLSYRWIVFAESHQRGARFIRTPLEGTWRLLTLRWPGWLRQHPLFDKDWYVETNRDVAGTRLRPWWHYVRHGVPEGRAPNRYFDREWYLRTYPDVKMTGSDPLDHYYRHGCWESRDPGPRFANDWYFAEHPEVAAAGMNPLLHFMRHGRHEGYQPRPWTPVGGSRRDGRLPRAGLVTAPARPRPPSEATPGPASVEAVAPPATTPALAAPAQADTKRVRKLVAATLEQGSRLGVISDGDQRLLEIPRVAVTPVPRGIGGDAAELPRNELSAIAHVESLRLAHIDYLLAPEPSLWLTVVPGLLTFLDTRYRRLSKTGSAATIWDVRSPLGTDASSGASGREGVLQGLKDHFTGEPSILDWDSGIEVARVLPTATVFSPGTTGTSGKGPLPYADDSIDVVVVAAVSDRESEARRVARVAVVSAPSGAADELPVVEWLGTEADCPAPSTSIIVPTYNDVSMVAACLRTIDETVPSRLDVEVIVVDDGSDESQAADLDALVAAHGRARLVRNAENGGYIAAVSAGAAAATRDVLIFLNNDTILLPGWLEPLLETLRDRPDVGVVGGMLLYPDGRLQEAGCAIFCDGSATKIGYGDDDPSLPYYAHPRSVDYVSGALLATPRALFEELGGFEEAYGFGYYEDGDYCFKARASGRDVVYQPRSVVVHVEGGTAGMDLTKGAKRF
ncbi:MAG: glycosyltransferase, partial [Chloroflexota bacterium]